MVYSNSKYLVFRQLNRETCGTRRWDTKIIHFLKNFCPTTKRCQVYISELRLKSYDLIMAPGPVDILIVRTFQSFLAEMQSSQEKFKSQNFSTQTPSTHVSPACQEVSTIIMSQHAVSIVFDNFNQELRLKKLVN